MNATTDDVLLHNKMKVLRDRIIFESKIVGFITVTAFILFFILDAILSMFLGNEHDFVSTIGSLAIALPFLAGIGLGIYVTYLSYKHIPEGFRLKFLMKYASQEDVLVREQTAGMAEDAKLWVEEDKKKREIH